MSQVQVRGSGEGGVGDSALHGQSMMNTIMAKDEIIGSGHKLMSFIMGKTDNMSYEKAQLTLLEIGQMQININDEPEARP